MLLTTAAGELLTLPTGDLLVTEGGTPTDPDPSDGYPATYTATYGG